MKNKDIIEIIEEKESEKATTDSKKAKSKVKTEEKGKKSKKDKKNKKVKKEKSKEKSLGENKKEQSKKLPKKIKERQIHCRDMFTPDVYDAPLSQVKSISVGIYVHDVHDVNPVIYEKKYDIRLKNNRFTTARISEEDYEYLLKQNLPVPHFITVVDCAVFPTLSYGFRAQELKNGKFPTIEEIEEVDKRYRENPANFHNPSLLAKIMKEQDKATAESAASLDDDEEF